MCAHCGELARSAASLASVTWFSHTRTTCGSRRWKLGMSEIAATCVTVDLRDASDTLRPMGSPIHEEAVGSPTDMPRPFFWNQSHIGFVDVLENSFSLEWIHALAKNTRTPQCFGLATPQKTQQKQKCLRKKGRFLKPSCTWCCMRGLKTGAEKWTLFLSRGDMGGVKNESGRYIFWRPSVRWPCHTNPSSPEVQWREHFAI